MSTEKKVEYSTDKQTVNADQKSEIVESNDDSDSSEHSTENEIAVVNSSETNYTNASSEVRKALTGEDRGVFMWRLVVGTIMILMSVLLTTATYLELLHSEEKDFKAAFHVKSQSFIADTNHVLRVHEESLEAMSAAITSYSLAIAQSQGKSTWPNVTIPSIEFDIHANHVSSLSNGNILWISPIVEESANWEAYKNSLVNTSDVTFHPTIFTYGEDGKVQSATDNGLFTPIHQVYSSQDQISKVNGSIINFDTFSDRDIQTATNISNVLRTSILSKLVRLPLIRDAYSQMIDTAEPLSTIVQPVFMSFSNDTKIVAYIQSLFEWTYLFSQFDGERGSIMCVVTNTCGDQFSILVDTNSAIYIGMTDAHDARFDALRITTIIGMNDDIVIDDAKAADACVHTLNIYPTTDFRDEFKANAGLFSAIVGIAMCIMVASFIAFDRVVKRRNQKVIKSAVQSTAIVSSLFPSNVRDRLYKEQEENENIKKKNHENLKTFLRDGTSSGDVERDNNYQMSSKPLADLFTETTVLFADIAGFTAWSSVREPCQVFILLETLYAAFDTIAHRRRIFKVETIGDCYVAVCGLPEPRGDHAMVMCKFACDIQDKMHKLSRELETSLGPDTGDLTLRIGLHSGPVTAGVLRGERARFQLFGDTMNTAARMEQTGTKGKIQISQCTADHIIAGGKSNWLRMREDKVVAKGKGELTTYWLDKRSNSSGCKSNRSSESGANSISESLSVGAEVHTIDTKKDKRLMSERLSRLVNWNVDVLCRIIQQIIINNTTSTSIISNVDDNRSKNTSICAGITPFDEVKEIIALRQVKNTKNHNVTSTGTISTEVSDQLRDYITKIAFMYNDNHFHNFEHASHVTMSVTKLLSRIISPSDLLDSDQDHANKDLASTLHDHTYGITSDPLIQFACVFSALIHDVDHPGVPNAQLAHENVELAERYSGKSIAEQNSIDLAWDLFMKDDYKELRNTICPTNDEFSRFRQLVVNSVMATDIMDKDLKNIRNMRWAKAFAESYTAKNENNCIENDDNNVHVAVIQEQVQLDEINRKATIVIEHMIQASDVSHTMQHWHIYRKWNERFFFECYDAYQNNRSSVDPTDGWYQGELDFFDYYIIPLAKKLKECGVFGVSSQEYLQYAMNNCSEWKSRGIEIVAEMKERALAAKSK